MENENGERGGRGLTAEGGEGGRISAHKWEEKGYVKLMVDGEIK